MRYYTDENISKALINALIDEGFDVLSCQAAGMLTTSDVEQLLFLLEEKRIIITRDDDFLKWHKKGAKHYGIIYIAPKMSDAQALIGISKINDKFAERMDKKSRRVFVIQPPKLKPTSWWKRLFGCRK